jgi:hypothetical protein
VQSLEPFRDGLADDRNGIDSIQMPHECLGNLTLLSPSSTIELGRSGAACETESEESNDTGSSADSLDSLDF